MAPSDPLADAAVGEPLARSMRIGNRSARLIALSDAVRPQLHALAVPEIAAGVANPDPVAAPDTDLSAQMACGHVLVVNSDPAFLDAVRVLLQSNRYNVTSTNLVPQTFAMVQAAGADALVIDLATDEPAQWELVSQLIADEQTRTLPVVFTGNDAEMLEAAETRPWPPGDAFICSNPSTRPCWVMSSTP